MNNDLVRELAVLQDELKKLKPAVEYVESASESVSKVDEKVPKLLEKMGALKISAKKLKGEIDKTFSSLQAIGEEVSGKIDGINNQVLEALNKFNEDGQNLKNELSQQFQSKISETEKLVSDIDVTLKSINEDYKSQVKSLIKEIKAKSKEIHSIYKELEKIKATRREYLAFMSKSEEKFTATLETLEASKLDSLNDKISSATADFSEKGETLRNELSEQVSNEISKSDEAIISAESAVKGIQSNYEEKVGSLIKEVTDKTSEIFFIYDELDKIKAAKDEYTDFLVSTENQFKSTLKTFKNEFDEVMKSADYPVLVDKIKKLTARLELLESHAHKHSFSGTKI
jgi:chromosome segregation ATPase